MDFRTTFDDEFPVDIDAAAYRSDAFWVLRTGSALFLSRLAATAFLNKHGPVEPDLPDALEDLNERSDQALAMLEEFCAGEPPDHARMDFLRGMIGGQVQDLQGLLVKLRADERDRRLASLDAWLSGVQYWAYWSFVLSCNRHLEQALHVAELAGTEDQWQQIHGEIERHESLGARVVTDMLTPDDRSLLVALYRRWAEFVEAELVPAARLHLPQA